MKTIEGKKHANTVRTVSRSGISGILNMIDYKMLTVLIKTGVKDCEKSKETP